MRLRAHWVRERAGRGRGVRSEPPKPGRRGGHRALAMADRFTEQLGQGMSRADIAREHGFTRARVTQLLRLLELNPAVLDHVRAGGDCPSARWLARRILR